MELPPPEEQDVQTATGLGLLSGTAFGIVAGAGKNYFDAHQTPALKNLPSPYPVIAKSAGTYAALGGIYLGVKSGMRQFRGKSDVWNGTVAGCAAGSVASVRAGNFATGGVACVCFAAVSAFLDTVGTLGSVNDVSERRKKAVYSPAHESSTANEISPDR